jgi:hypothetical protein
MSNLSISEIREKIAALEAYSETSDQGFDAYCEYCDSIAHYEHLLRTTEPMYGLEHPEWVLVKIAEGAVEERFWPHWVKYQVEEQRLLDESEDYKDYASHISYWLTQQAEACLTRRQRKAFYQWADPRNLLSGSDTPKSTLEAINRL